ncbi:MAG: VOC family protein [Actinobacteria bacterium]|nr:VOC family protein [Actinomycetota bacterium]
MEPLFTDIHQIGLVVENVKETLKNYTKNYGIGPWNVWEFNSGMVEDMEVRGKKVNYRMMVATCKSFNVDWEIIQPMDDKSIYSGFLEQTGEGLQHINYVVRDYDHAIKHLKNMGVEISQYGNLLGKHIYVYFDTEKDAKHIMETSTDLPGLKRCEPQFIYPPANSKIPEPVFKRIEQIGIVVKNIKKTSDVLREKYMLEPWEFHKVDPTTAQDLQIDGNRVAYSYSIALCRIGGIYLKLVEPHDEKSIFSQHLEKFGEGIHHVCFSVDNIDEVSLKIGGKGNKIIQSGSCNGHRFVYFSTKRDLKFNACFYENDS